MAERGAGAARGRRKPATVRTGGARRSTGSGTRRRAASHRRRLAWRALGALAVEAAAVVGTVLVLVTGALGTFAGWLGATGRGPGLVPFASMVLVVGLVGAVCLRAWLSVRPMMLQATTWLPLAAACMLGAGGWWLAARPAYEVRLETLRAWIGGQAAAQRATIAHQVYATYRRTDPRAWERLLERARGYEPTVLEAAAAFGVDPEVLMGVAAAESSFLPRDSTDGGRGLFQITAPPADAVADVRGALGVDRVDPLDHRHNAYLAAATLRRYLQAMRGDFFLGLLAYNIGPRNGGLASIMSQYGARDFTTIQPYLQNLPRDYPIRVLAGALAYRVWHREGRLLRYEEADNAVRIQRMGVPGLEGEAA